MENAPLNKEQKNTFLTTCLVVRAEVKILVIMRRLPIYSVDMGNASSLLLSSSISKLTVFMKKVDGMVKDFQTCTF